MKVLMWVCTVQETAGSNPPYTVRLSEMLGVSKKGWDWSLSSAFTLYERTEAKEQVTPPVPSDTRTTCSRCNWLCDLKPPHACLWTNWPGTSRHESKIPLPMFTWARHLTLNCFGGGSPWSTGRSGCTWQLLGVNVSYCVSLEQHSS